MQTSNQIYKVNSDNEVLSTQKKNLVKNLKSKNVGKFLKEYAVNKLIEKIKPQNQTREIKIPASIEQKITPEQFLLFTFLQEVIKPSLKFSISLNDSFENEIRYNLALEILNTLINSNLPGDDSNLPGDDSNLPKDN